MKTLTLCQIVVGYPSSHGPTPPRITIFGPQSSNIELNSQWFVKSLIIKANSFRPLQNKSVIFLQKARSGDNRKEGQENDLTLRQAFDDRRFRAGQVFSFGRKMFSQLALKLKLLKEISTSSSSGTLSRDSKSRCLYSYE